MSETLMEDAARDLDATRSLFPLLGSAVAVKGTDIEGTLWGITPRGAIVQVALSKPLLTVAAVDIVLK